MSKFIVLVLGGYGSFGSRIASALSRDAGLRIIVAGRNLDAASALIEHLRESSQANLDAIALDIEGQDFSTRLQSLHPDLIIHTCGPFQGDDYRVARSALAVGAHYLDLADAREFVCGIGTLDGEARNANKLVVAGASSVPGLSSAVVDTYLNEFAELREIEIGISPGNRAPRGLATVAAILSYCGESISIWLNGRWTHAHGWQSQQRHRYPNPVGTRWLGICDVPDLTLFPQRYPGVRRVQFRAGLELKRMHLGLWALSWLRRLRLLPRLDRFAPLLKRMSEWFLHTGSDAGAMHVQLRGRDHAGHDLQLTWSLIAEAGDGPQIPATAAVAIAKKLARGELAISGAQPCLGLFTLDEFMAELHGYAIHAEVVRKYTAL